LAKLVVGNDKMELSRFCYYSVVAANIIWVLCVCVCVCVFFCVYLIKVYLLCMLLQCVYLSIISNAFESQPENHHSLCKEYLPNQQIQAILFCLLIPERIFNFNKVHQIIKPTTWNRRLWLWIISSW
jgi:hypothetical protein